MLKSRRQGVNWDIFQSSDFAQIKHEAFKWSNFKIKTIKKCEYFILLRNGQQILGKALVSATQLSGAQKLWNEQERERT